MTRVPPMTEEQLQSAVIGLCKYLGIMWYHPHDSRRSVEGWPDLALCGTCGMLFRELKTDRGRITEQQSHWGYRLKVAGQDWDVWRPADLASGRILRELEGIR